MYNTFPGLISTHKGFYRFQGLKFFLGNRWIRRKIRWITIYNAGNMYSKFCVYVLYIYIIYIIIIIFIYTHMYTLSEWHGLGAKLHFSVTHYLMYKYPSVVA